MHFLQEYYADDRRIWNSLFEMVLRDVASAEHNGIQIRGGQGQKFWPIVIGNKGDWSYLEPCLCPDPKLFFFWEEFS